MALTKSIQEAIRGNPVDPLHQPVPAELVTLLTELTNGSLPLFVNGGQVALGTVAPGALAFGTQNHVTVTPNATGTFTSTVPAAGTICTLEIITAGASSYTLTFGAGFKVVGTLATGTVTAKTFMVTFKSNGTTLNEIARTVAM